MAKEWEVDEKVLCCVTDTATNLTKGITKKGFSTKAQSPQRS